MEDAALCISKDPKFIKGYFRLATAQIELNLLDDAEASIKVGESLDVGKDRYLPWLNIIRV